MLRNLLKILAFVQQNESQKKRVETLFPTLFLGLYILSMTYFATYLTTLSSVAKVTSMDNVLLPLNTFNVT